MKEVFAFVCASALSATWFALAVIVLRLVFRKAPKWIVCALWGIVALRLVFPVTFETGIGIAPDSRKITENIIGSYSQEEQTAPSIGDKTPGHAVTPGNSSDPSPVQGTDVITPVIDEAAVPGMAGTLSPSGEEKEPLTHSRSGVTPVLTEEDAGTKVDLASVLSAVWLAGAGGMLVYALVSYVLLKKKVATSTRLRDNIYQSENVGSPFILGVFRPKIYLPYTTDGRDLEYVVAHERAHLKRKDHLWKPIGFLLLALFWFDPVMWVSFALFCRDVEGACDEKVIGKLDEPSKKEYSSALLNCSAKRFSISACPVAFGETGVRERVKRVLNYKKPAFWVIILLVVASAAAGVLLLTTRTGGNTVRRADVQKLEYGMKMSEVLEILGDSKGDVGSGAIVLEWDVEGGETLRVTFNPPADHKSDATEETQSWEVEVIKMSTSFKDLIKDLERKAAELDAADFDSAVATVVKDHGIYEVHRSEIESDLLLFQYGTYDMRDGKGKRFVLNITRQFFLKGEDEPYQFGIDRFYDAEPFSDVGDFTLWSDECASVREFENRIKNSPGYKKAPEHEPTDREVYFDDENGSRSWSYVRPGTVPETDDKTASPENPGGGFEIKRTGDDAGYTVLVYGTDGKVVGTLGEYKLRPKVRGGEKTVYVTYDSVTDPLGRKTVAVDRKTGTQTERRSDVLLYSENAVVYCDDFGDQLLQYRISIVRPGKETVCIDEFSAYLSGTNKPFAAALSDDGKTADISYHSYNSEVTESFDISSSEPRSLKVTEQKYGITVVYDPNYVDGRTNYFRSAATLYFRDSGGKDCGSVRLDRFSGLSLNLMSDGVIEVHHGSGNFFSTFYFDPLTGRLSQEYGMTISYENGLVVLPDYDGHGNHFLTIRSAFDDSYSCRVYDAFPQWATFGTSMLASISKDRSTVTYSFPPDYNADFITRTLVLPENGGTVDGRNGKTYPEIGDVPAEKSSMIVLDYYDCIHAPQFKDTEKVKVTLTFNVPYDWHKETETSNWFVAKLGYYDFEVVVMDSFRPFRVEKDYVLGKDILSITQRKTSTLEEDIDPDKYEDRLSFGKTKSGREYLLFEELQYEAEHSGKKWTEYVSKLFFRASDEIVVKIVFRDDTPGNATVYKIIDSMEAEVILEPIPEDTRQIETDRADKEPTEVPSDISLFRYSVENGCAIITGLTDDSVTEAVVPSEIDGCPVTEIGSLAFAFSGDLGRVVLPKTVRKIGESAFYGCSSLVSVNIPYGVSEIGTTAFKNCVSLKRIIIPSSVTRIEGETFIHCESLESVSLSGSLKIIGERAFAFCGSLKKLTVPGSVETIEGGAFYKCTALSEISLPDTAIEMGGAVFLDTAWKKSQPEGLIYIGKILYGYRGACPENVSVRPGTVCIAGTAFAGASTLKSITIPSSVKYIGNRAFYMCSSISEATVHASLLEAYPNFLAGYPDLKLTVVS